jgi:hypothetical protein
VATELEILRKAVAVLTDYASKEEPPTDGDKLGLALLADNFEAWADRIDAERMTPPEGSEINAEGFGTLWAPQPGVTFLGSGALTRSIVGVSPPPVHGLVGVDLKGKWNHGAADTLSLIVNPGVAQEWGNDLLDAAAQAPLDAEVYIRKIRES